MIALALLAWALVAAPVALLVGNSIKVADQVAEATRRDVAERQEWLA